MGWSAWSRGTRWACCLTAAALLGVVGCAPGPLHPAVARVACGSAPAAATVPLPAPPGGGALPVSLVDASAVPGTRQAWVIAGRYGDPFESGSYLLHVTGRSWTEAAAFGRDVHLNGVAAASATAAWVWGDQGHGDDWNTFRPYLALVSGGAVCPVRAGLLSTTTVTAMAGDGSGGVWLAGRVHERHGPHLRALVARWNGTSWHQVPAPPGVRAVWSMSASGSSDAWAVVSEGYDVDPWLVHWDGTAWSTAYTPPASLAAGERVPQEMAAGSSPGRAWVAYTEGGTNSGSDARNPAPRIYAAYFDGGTWRTVPVPRLVREGLAEITVSGGDAWAISAYQSIGGILHSRLGRAWTVQALPSGRYHRPCIPTSLSAASPGYVIAVTGRSSGWCRLSFAYVYDGRRWLPVSPRQGTRQAS